MSGPKDKYSSPFDKKARVVGIVMTVLMHAVILCICGSAGLKYIYPPPAEQGILLEFIPDEPKPAQVARGVEPRVVKADPEKEIRLVQKSEAPEQGLAENKSAEATIGEEGDVEKPEPPRPKPIDTRALFSSNKNATDTNSRQVAATPSDKLKAGHAEGNTKTGNTDGAPTAQLEGRTVMGNLPIPQYDVEKGGKVVVTIMVDYQGKVTNAIPGAPGTTVQDATLWEAAKKAALKAVFDPTPSSTETQRGTITYIFKLK